jgi:hypothetical protein
MIFRDLGVSRSSRRCFLVSSRRTGRIKSLAGTCRHFNELWYINIQGPHMLHIEKVIEVRCAETGLTQLHDLTAFSRSLFDQSNTRRRSGTATDSNSELLELDDYEHTLTNLESIHGRTYGESLYSTRQPRRTSSSPNTLGTPYENSVRGWKCAVGVTATLVSVSQRYYIASVVYQLWYLHHIYTAF